MIKYLEAAGRANFFGGVVQSDDSWLNQLPVDVVRAAPGKYYGRTVDGVWVSAGAKYGAQVEFKSFGDAQAFIAANPTCTRPAVGTKHPRVVCDDVVTFVAAYNAVVGKAPKAEAPKAEAAPVAALVAPTIDIASVLVAALAAGRSQEEVLALIAALKA